MAVSSILPLLSGAIGNIGQANYAASKAAVIGLTKTVAREYASRMVTVNAVAPGFIDTAMTQTLSQEVQEALLNQIPCRRLGQPSDVAEAVCFLASRWSWVHHWTSATCEWRHAYGLSSKEAKYRPSHEQRNSVHEKP